MPPIIAMTDVPPSPVGHTDSFTVAAFLDGRLYGRARDTLVTHLAECAECRREVVELQQALGTNGQSTQARRSSRPGIVMAIAAVLLVSIILPQLRTVQTADALDEDRVRTGTPSIAANRAALIAMLQPGDGATVSNSDAVFLWSSSGRDATYQLTIQDSVGNTVWSSAGADTSAVLADSVRLRAGSYYFWSVQARRADGYSTRSVTQTFQAK